MDALDVLADVLNGAKDLSALSALSSAISAPGAATAAVAVALGHGLASSMKVGGSPALAEEGSALRGFDLEEPSPDFRKMSRADRLRHLEAKLKDSSFASRIGKDDRFSPQVDATRRLGFEEMMRMDSDLQHEGRTFANPVQYRSQASRTVDHDQPGYEARRTVISPVSAIKAPMPTLSLEAMLQDRRARDHDLDGSPSM
jgi:hypothetical protein